MSKILLGPKFGFLSFAWYIADFDSNNDIFSRAVWKLLFILSKWTGFAPNHDRQQGGLTLELGAYSPSDSKHTFRDFHLEPDYPYQEEIDIDRKWDAYKLRNETLGLDNLNDPYHGWIDGRQDSITLGSKLRLMGTLNINLKLPGYRRFKKFPKVKIVTTLLIRRQF